MFAVLSMLISFVKAEISIVDTYGTLDIGSVYSNQVQIQDINTNNTFRFRPRMLQNSSIGLKNTEDLRSRNGVRVLFNVEAGLSSNSDIIEDHGSHDFFFQKRAVVGLDGDFGVVLLGRQSNLPDTVSAYTGASDFGSFAANTNSNTMNMNNVLIKNSMYYITNTVNGFTGSALYGFGRGIDFISQGHVFNVNGKYEIGHLVVGASYYGVTLNNYGVNTNSTNSQQTRSKLDNNKMQTVALIASYQLGLARIYGNISHVTRSLSALTLKELIAKNSSINSALKFSNQANLYEFGMAYALNSNLKLLANVQHARADFNNFNTIGHVTQVNLGADYWLSRRTDLYAVISSIHTNNIANFGIKRRNIQMAIGIGIRHKF